MHWQISEERSVEDARAPRRGAASRERRVASPVRGRARPASNPRLSTGSAFTFGILRNVLHTQCSVAVYVCMESVQHGIRGRGARRGHTSTRAHDHESSLTALLTRTRAQHQTAAELHGLGASAGFHAAGVTRGGARGVGPEEWGPRGGARAEGWDPGGVVGMGCAPGLSGWG